MDKKQVPIVIHTLGDWIEQCMSLTAYCRDVRVCHHSAKVDLFALADRVGLNVPIKAVLARLRCGKCGGPSEVRISAPTSSWDRERLEAERDRRRAERSGTESPKRD